ncbi:MAG TPA: 4'-phosphopantetheinyl transferase superfamily protein, partial [Terriglobales bacterium]|nr:4'-phosphopantetheinyl transferase superfamily protein [Terriglobales bacterium]
EVLRLRRMRFAKRRADWRLGRWTAKCAVAAYLGRPIGPDCLSDLEIRPALSGAPEVFLAGQPATVAISLSHSSGKAMAAVVPSGIALGCDLETIEPRSDIFLADYFTSEEQFLVACAPVPDRPELVALLWSAKESALKAMHQGLRLDTRSVLVKSVGRDRHSGYGVQTSDKHATQELRPTDRECSQHEWRALQLLYTTEGRMFHGWWQSADNFVRTMVADLPLPPPVLLGSQF